MPLLPLLYSRSETLNSSFVIETTDNHNAARILLMDVLSEIARAAQEDLVIAIPSQELFIATGISNRQGIHWLKSQAMQRFQSSPEPVSNQLFWFQHGRSLLKEGADP